MSLRGGVFIVRSAMALISAGYAATPALAAPPISAEVSSYAIAMPIAGARYVILPEEQLATDTFQFNEFSAHVERALSTKGLLRVSSLSEASLIVYIGYGIGEPETRIGSSSIPIYGQRGIVSSTTLGTVSSTDSVRATTTPGYGQSGSTYGTVSSTGSVSATTTYVPSYGITGWSTDNYSYTTYARWLRIEGVNANGAKAVGKVDPLWRTEVRSVGSISDLRQVLPAMAYAAVKYVGTDTGKAVLVKVKDKSKEYRAFLAAPVTGGRRQVP